MRLLVSVSNAQEAAAALAGGADVIDAKDPRAGPLGAVGLATLRDIVRAVSGARPVTAALGDATDPARLREAVHACAAQGTWLVKTGFAGVAEAGAVESLLAAALQGASDAARAAGAPSSCGVIAVAYADAGRAAALPVEDILAAAARTTIAGILVDTFDKAGPGLRRLVSGDTLRGWVDAAHAAGLLVALAGRLTAGDLPWVREAGADVAGVRGAACGGDRLSEVSVTQVHMLRARMEAESQAGSMATQRRTIGGAGPT